MKSPEQIETEAAFWVVRLDRGLTAAEQDGFHDWLAADSRHGEALAHQRAGWDRLDRLADWRPQHSLRPNRDLLAEAPPMTWRRAARPTIAAALALAALVVLAMFLRPQGPAAPASPHPPPIALIEKFPLPDGSTALLNRDAEMKVRFTREERTITLVRGEVHFEVARDPTRPFRVEAGGISVRAVGTAFSVHVQGDALRVLVTEGQVQVQPPSGLDPVFAGDGGGAKVAAGQRCVIPLSRPAVPAVSTVSTAEMQAAQAWHPRLLDFTETALATILDEFNRHNAPYRIIAADPNLAGLVLSASLRSDNIEGFLRLLEGGFGIRAERSGSMVTLRRVHRD